MPSLPENGQKQLLGEVLNQAKCTVLSALKKPAGATELGEQRRDCLSLMSVSVMSKSMVP